MGRNLKSHFAHFSVEVSSFGASGLFTFSDRALRVFLSSQHTSGHSDQMPENIADAAPSILNPSPKASFREDEAPLTVDAQEARLDGNDPIPSQRTTRRFRQTLQAVSRAASIIQLLTILDTVNPLWRSLCLQRTQQIPPRHQPSAASYSMIPVPHAVPDESHSAKSGR